MAAKLILDIGWLEAMLFGAIVGSTDAAAVFAVLKGQNIRTKIGATLEAESGSNDPMAVFLTIALIDLITVPNANLLAMIGSFFIQMSVGVILGLLYGKLAVWALNRINLDSGDKLIAPIGTTIIQPGDFLYILSARKNKNSIKQLLQEKALDKDGS